LYYVNLINHQKYSENLFVYTQMRILQTYFSVRAIHVGLRPDAATGKNVWLDGTEIIPGFPILRNNAGSVSYAMLGGQFDDPSADPDPVAYYVCQANFDNLPNY